MGTAAITPCTVHYGSLLIKTLYTDIMGPLLIKTLLHENKTLSRLLIPDELWDRKTCCLLQQIVYDAWKKYS